MGEEAVKEEIEQVTEVVVSEDSVPEVAQPAEISTEEDGADVGVNDIVLEGTQPLFDQQAMDRVVQGRVKKLSGKLVEATDQVSASDERASLAESRAQILTLALEQERSKNNSQPATEPNADDYDLGHEDPNYRKKLSEFNQSWMKAEVSKQVAQSQQNFTTDNAANATAQERERKQRKHYAKADELGVKDYDAKEDKAIEILGLERTNQLIEHIDDAHKILYYFGANEAAAKNFKSIMDNDLVKGLLEIGRLQASLVVKPRTSNAPDPDIELEGGVTRGADKDKKYDRLVEEAAQTGDMKKLLAYQREQRQLIHQAGWDTIESRNYG